MDRKKLFEAVRRSRNKRILAAVLLVVGICSLSLLHTCAAGAQTRAGEGREPAVDRAAQAAIIDSISVALNKTYVFPDVAQKIEKHLKKKLKKNEYASLNTLQAFTEQLTGDMAEIAHDRHLWARPASEQEIGQSRREEPTDEDIAGFIAQQAYANFGFEKVERLDNNIGYLKFNQFADAAYGGATAVAAMNFLENCDAIIIDLRENGGGSPSMVQLISSYFFDETTHLNTFYIRASDAMHQFWTQAHVQGKRMADVPLFVLTSARTFSGAEEFTYNMRNLERATIIGETTGGGAHPTERFVFGDLGVTASIPFGRAINPITNTNWEGTGVEPHIKVPQEEALDVAKLEALKLLLERSDDEQRKATIAFALQRLEALGNPAEISIDVMKGYVGDYGPRHIILENGELWYQRDDRPKYRMIPISETLFCFEEYDFFKLQIETDDAGNPVALVGLYDTGQTDRSPRDGE